MKILPNIPIRNNQELFKFLSKNKNHFLSLVYDTGIFQNNLNIRNLEEWLQIFENKEFKWSNSLLSYSLPLISCNDIDGNWFGFYSTITPCSYPWVILHNTAIFLMY